MTVGLSAANFANPILDALDGSAPTLTASHVQVHTGDPGASGTANQIGAGVGNDRQSLSWDTAAAGSRSIDNQPEWADWDSGTETVTDISTWDNGTTGSGNFRFSAELTTPREVNDDDTLRLTSLTFTFTPIAA